MQIICHCLRVYEIPHMKSCFYIFEHVWKMMEVKNSQIKVFYLSGNSKGLAAVPGREEEFKQCLELSIKYAEAVRCTR